MHDFDRFVRERITYVIRSFPDNTPEELSAMIHFALQEGSVLSDEFFDYEAYAEERKRRERPATLVGSEGLTVEDLPIAKIDGPGE